MQMKKKKVIIAVALFAAGAAAGWFASGVANSPDDDLGRARCPRCADAGGMGRVAIPDVGSSAAKPKQKAPILSAESEWAPPVELPGEKPKENVEEQSADKGVKPDNPFPRYLDMFKNNPEALVAEFEKEVEKDRAEQRQLRDWAVAKLKLNKEQAAVFEKTLDDLRDEMRQLSEEAVGLVTSGQLNEDSAEDGSIWSSNHLLIQRSVAARATAVRETAEKLYEQLAFDGVSDAEAQETIRWVAKNTADSIECLEPNLQVYDKVYKNMGCGEGIFSWCNRQRRSQKK